MVTHKSPHMPLWIIKQAMWGLRMIKNSSVMDEAHVKNGDGCDSSRTINFRIKYNKLCDGLESSDLENVHVSSHS